MRRNIVVDFPSTPALEKQPIELVERKGVGHPDSICDGIAESVSRALSNEYLDRYGKILHHNTDQVELVGGKATPRFGGGEVDLPTYILLSGRAVTQVEKETIPVGEIAISAAEEYLASTIKNLDVASDIELDEKIGQGSSDLRCVFAKEGMPCANDTSFGVGFAPFSTTERLVYGTERFIIEEGPREIGEDIKVMGFRKGDKINLTIAAAAVSRHLDNLDAYKSLMEELHENVCDYVCSETDKEVEVFINTADDYSKESVFLTVTGTSAEQGDDGSVGRGNRANGLITPYRPMSMEATSGKNPVNHVGKLYNLLSNKIAEDIASEGAEQVYVKLLSQIGKPIDQPMVASIHLKGDPAMEAEARRAADYWLENIREITELCVQGKVSTF